ncbi:hypothetical protein Tsubulata_014558 [Turnera subulata]|uniref:F-box domain-containing protein n=1 Tax=Turnera subulata TaxID=218843 RepID=A0A9Q0FGW3_9ROSI|nr:hypothetical protein Tsubulata_014558 [Turnera subulata]
MDRRKRPRISRKPTTKSDLFDQFPDDLVVSILIRLTSSSSPLDFMLGFSSIRMQIRFYCVQTRGSGALLMAKAAIKSHAPALYSLSIIQFNGSGGSKSDKDLRAGVPEPLRGPPVPHPGQRTGAADVVAAAPGFVVPLSSIIDFAFVNVIELCVGGLMKKLGFDCVLVDSSLCWWINEDDDSGVYLLVVRGGPTPRMTPCGLCYSVEVS